ncbi:MAG: YhbY family RNA-binding protein [Clostridiales bacterium]|nr:YhbY family RNA-binding protein [Clostridiales bacterium]
MNSRQRAYLKGLAMNIEPSFQVGKGMITPQNTEAIAESLEANELIKINVLNNCVDEPKNIASILAERTNSEIVQVIGRKIVLYKVSKNKKKISLEVKKIR